MKYFECSIKKIELMKYIKAHLKNYMLTEEDEEYQEIYNYYTSASYTIKPNKFKANPSSASLHIDRENSLVMLLGGTRSEQIELFEKFNHAPVNNDLVIETFKKVYYIANKFKFYDNNNIHKVTTHLENWLNNSESLKGQTEVGLKYGLVGKMTTGRSKAITGQFYLNEYFYMANDLTILTCHTLEFPMKGLFKMTIAILHNGNDTFIYLTKTENGDNNDVTDSEILVSAMNDKFLERYQAAVKKWLNQEKADFNEDYLLLLEMMKI